MAAFGRISTVHTRRSLELPPRSQAPELTYDH
jgi:hypothetical protein